MTTVKENGHFFEGTEKLLEVWFESTTLDSADLRTISRPVWEELLKHVNCQVLNVIQNDTLTAYLLSESSMFVSKERFILKTCGKTTLLCAMEPLLNLVKKAGFDKVTDVYYSRKNYMKPELQHEIHRSFDDEVSHLEDMFDHGAAYALGRINRDCWYLYTIEEQGVDLADQTLELLMQDLDAKQMAVFSTAVSKNGAEATKRSGISSLLPGSMIDDWLFDPCGYSMNGILPDGQYFTIHITPEPDFSYVSFETNVPRSSYHDLVMKVLDIFRPGKFLMTLFANEPSPAWGVHTELRNYGLFEGYKRHDHQFSQVKNYYLTYTGYVRQNKNGLKAEPPH